MKITAVLGAIGAIAFSSAGIPQLTPAALAQLPSKAVPEGMRAIPTGGSGRILTAHTTGITDARKMLVGLKYHARDYFDAPFTVTRVYADQNDQHLQASFVAKLKGVPIHGIAAISLALDDDSNADGTLIFDNAKTFSKSLKALVARQNGSGGSGNAGSAIKLTRQTAPDGSCQISLPPGYRITGAFKGTLDVVGPHGEVMALGAPVLCTSHQAAALFFQLPPVDFSDPVQAMLDYLGFLGRQSGNSIPARVIDSKSVSLGLPGRSAFIRYSFHQNGTQYEAFGLFSISQTDVNQGLLYCTYFVAPEASYRAQFPGMLRAWGTWSINPAVFTERLMAAAQSLRGMSDIIASHEDYKNRTEAKVFEAWSDVARDQGTWENPDTGNRYKIPNSYTNLGAPTQGGVELQAVPLGDL